MSAERQKKPGGSGDPTSSELERDDQGSVGDILDRLEEVASGEKVSIGQVTESFGHRSIGPFLFVPAILDISPIGAIPGLPTALALLLLLFAVQVAIGRDHLWLPSFIEQRHIRADRLRASVDKLRSTGRWLDRWFHGRLAALTTKRFVQVAGIAATGMTFLVPPLELFPFATTLPMGTIAIFGLAITVRDGLLMVAGLILAAVSLGIGVWFLLA